MKITLLLLACLIAPVTAPAAEVPVGLECSAATVIHSNAFPESGTSADNQNALNHCVSEVQAYARAHCPQSKRTIWQQVEAVAFSGPGKPDAEALVAACD